MEDVTTSEGLRSRSSFDSLAEQICKWAKPVSVLDVGCGPGLLVQALCARGVDAYGIDRSERAIDRAHPDVFPRLSVGSAREISRSWDLITCIGLLDLMDPVESELAIDAMTSASDRVLLTARCSDASKAIIDGPRKPAAWSASFADRGFFRRTDIDFSFLTPWFGLFERGDLTEREIVYRYECYTLDLGREMPERCFGPLTSDRHDHEWAAKQQDASAQTGPAALQRIVDDTKAANLALRHRLLTSRDDAIGAEAEAAHFRQQYEQSAAERDRARAEAAHFRQQYEESAAERDRARAEAALLHEYVHEVRTSTTWRIGGAVVRPVTWLLSRVG